MGKRTCGRSAGGCGAVKRGEEGPWLKGGFALLKSAGTIAVLFTDRRLPFTVCRCGGKVLGFWPPASCTMPDI